MQVMLNGNMIKTKTNSYYKYSRIWNLTMHTQQNYRMTMARLMLMQACCTECLGVLILVGVAPASRTNCTGRPKGIITHAYICTHTNMACIHTFQILLIYQFQNVFLYVYHNEFHKHAKVGVCPRESYIDTCA